MHIFMFGLKRNLVLLGVATFILLVIVGLAYREWKRYSSANADALRTHETLDAVAAVLAGAIDAETGKRGYLLTGEDRYLEPYNRAIQTLPSEAAHLIKLVVGRQNESVQAREINHLLDEKLAELRRTIERRRTKSVTPAVVVVITDQAELAMDQIRVRCGQIRREELAAWREDSREREDAARTTLLVTLGGSLAILLLFAVGIDPVIKTDVRGGKSHQRVYGVAVLATVAGILVRIALTPLIGASAVPFLTFFPVVLFVAWYGGFRAGALSVLLSGLAADYYFAAPVGSFAFADPADQVTLIVFVLAGLGVAVLGHSQKTALELADREAEQRRVAENIEREQRQRFETTLASIGDAVIATDAEGRITFSNRVARSLLRASEAEVAGRPLDDVFRIVNEFSRAKVESPVAKALREGAIVGLANHTVLIAQDGTEIPIDDSAAPIHGESGSIRGTVLVFRDITARRQTEATGRLLASIVESSSDGIISKDLNGVVTSWNKGAEDMFGYSAEEMIGQPIALLVPPGRQDEMPEILERIKRNERVDHYRTVRRTKRGELIHTAVTISPVLDAVGRVIGASKIVRDITAQVRAQAEVAEQRERLRVTLNSIGDAVLTTDASGLVAYLNPVAERLTGWTSAEAAGQKIEDVFHIVTETSRQAAEDPVTRVLREGGIVGLANHTILISRQGKEIAIDDSAAPIRIKSGETVGVVLIFRDVTERRETEKRLAAQAAELREKSQLMERSHSFVRDLEDRIVYWNQGAADLYGFSAAEAVGQTSHSLLKTEFPVPLDEILPQLMREGCWDGDLVHTCRDGRRVTVASHWALHRDAEGRVASILEVNVDITERKQVEQMLQESEDRFRSMANAIPQLAWMANADGWVSWYNDRWYEYTGTTAEQMEGWGWQSVHDPEVLPTVLERWQASIDSGEPFDMVFPLRARDGVLHPFLTRILPVRGQDGQVTRWFGTSTDITAHVDLQAKERALLSERELRKTEAELARLARVLTVGELTASIAHEVSQPLAGVVTNAEAGLRWLDGETPNLDEARNTLEYIARDGNRAGEVIRRIRALLTKEAPRFEPVDLNKKVTDALALAQAALLQNRVSARVELSEDLPAVMGDRIQLQQVILNLIMNASEAMASTADRTRELLVTTQRSADGAIHVAVRDSGPGGKTQDFERMFEAFYTTKSNGMGMGLAISRSIIEAHDGRIWASCNGDEPGLAVQFSLPAARAKSVSAP